jgi:acyl-coenzyme A thioesterase PaaI-like protein
MRAATHAAIDARLCGTPVELAPGRARVELTTVAEMAADARGLVHGGFVFGLADYAAMLAVGHPHVVLAGAEVRFLAPAAVGDRLVAEAALEAPAPTADGRGRRRRVAVRVRRGEVELFSGDFHCAVPERHVLDRAAG